jgi:uncharacterized protein (TIGR02996 family)
MSTYEGLLSAIRDEPYSDEPRLILADWLDDHGEPERAEFIRVQCALGRLPEYHDFRPDLEARERGLLLLHKDEWLSSSGLGYAERFFSRGFVERVDISARVLLDHPDTLLGSGLVRHLSVHFGEESEFAALARLPQLRSVRRLSLSGGDLPPSALGALLDSPYLQQLTALALAFDEVSRDTLARLAGALRSLHEVNLSQCGLGPEILAAFLPVEPSALVDLNLCYNALDDAGVNALANSQHLGQLRHLTLCGIGMTEDGVAALARAPFAGQLETLDLANNNRLTGPPSLLGRCFPSLRYLSLLGSPFDWTATLPGNMDQQSTLRELLVGNVSDSLAELATWLRLPALAGLEYLWINAGSPVPLDTLPPLIETLSAAPSLARLRCLVLFATLTVEELAHLLSGPHARNWQSLRLIICHLDDDGAAILANCEALSGLRELNLSGNVLGNAATASLARSPYLKRLTSLDLGQNRITDASAFAGTYLANPAILNLYGNTSITAQEELARAGIEAMRQMDIAPILARLALEDRP